MQIRNCALVAAASFFPASLFAGGWGADVNTGAGGPLVESVRADLAAIVKASDADRPALYKAYAEKRAPDAIEAIKRFRNPELKHLFYQLLRNGDWKVKHRALLALESYGDASPVSMAWEMLSDPEARLRERAAIFCIKLWGPYAAKDVAGEKPGDALKALLEKETDDHVRACLTALAARIAGKLTVDKVSTEYVRKLDDGLMVTPFLDGMDKVKSVAPDYVAKPVPRQGGASASTLPTASKWTYPLCAWGNEQVNGSLQPFANLRQNGAVYHTGQDVGCCLDGAGYYAIADGIVKFVHTGSDMGTLIVVEHNTGEGLECAVYMHGGDTVFAKAGDKVACGQLLGTMGLSYSIENGGHFAHLHFGLYPGAFSVTHNYGYKAVSAGLADWHDPSRWLVERIEATRPLIARSPEWPPSVRVLVLEEHYGDAHAEATKKGDAAAIAAIEAGVGEAQIRSEARRESGHPTDALAWLKKWAGAFKGVPGAEKLDEASKAWDKDAAFKKALAGEKEIAALENQIAAKKPAAAETKLAWEALLKKFAGTCLEGRLKARVEGK